MTSDQDLHAQLSAFNQAADFNRWCRLEVKSATAGQVELTMPWRAELGQYSGFLHAGLIGALIDAACGFAAVTVAGPRGHLTWLPPGAPWPAGCGWPRGSVAAIAKAGTELQHGHHRSLRN